jgi:diguanylate cyclase (GGDEF)-like protein
MDPDVTVVEPKIIRWLSLIGTFLLCTFIVADLSVLPKSLQDVYFTSRLFVQLPICTIFFLLTFFPFYSKIHQLTVCSVMLTLIYSNYWLIVQCWKLDGFAFPYEGTIIYSLFALFVFRISFHCASILCAVALLGYTFLTLSYPVYGVSNLINLCFVASSMIVGLLGLYQIESGLKKLRMMNSKLTGLSQIDQLTNIYNRGTYEARFSEQLELNKRNGNTMCVFIVDLDSFKKYNDGYGHLQGDKVIKLQAEMLSRIFRRTNDIVARYGGEEFVVVTSNNTEQECEKLAQQIIEEWRTQNIPHSNSDDKGHVTCSVGYYFEPINSQSVKDAMVDKADKALYQAKANGRNCFVRYQDGISDISTRNIITI